jgi:cobalt-zinc-cadmium efflux system outer membrane protein
MRTLLLPFLCLAGCLAAGAATAQTTDIPTRLSLSDAVRLAEARNPALDAARQQVALAEADAASARRRLNPVADVLSEGYHGQSGGARFFDQQELSVRVGQEFELAGKRRLRSQAADAATGRSRSTLDDQVRQLRLDVQRAYFQLVLARLDADLAKASLTEIDRMIAVNRSRYQQGEVSGSELRRLEVERFKFSDDALQADLGIRNSRAALLALLGALRLDLPVEPTATLPGSPERRRTAGSREVSCAPAR